MIAVTNPTNVSIPSRRSPDSDSAPPGLRNRPTLTTSALPVTAPGDPPSPSPSSPIGSTQSNHDNLSPEAGEVNYVVEDHGDLAAPLDQIDNIDPDSPSAPFISRFCELLGSYDDNCWPVFCDMLAK